MPLQTLTSLHSLILFQVRQKQTCWTPETSLAFTSCSLSWCLGSLHLLRYCWVALLFTPCIPCRDLHTHPLSFSPTHSHSQQDGCLFNPKPSMESAYCLWFTYSRWANISQLRPLFSFYRGPSLKKYELVWPSHQAGPGTHYARDSTFPLPPPPRLLFCVSRAPGWYYRMLCFYKYRLWFGHKYTYLVN